MALLMIFIDGLSYSEAVAKINILADKKVCKVTPGAGFSNNLYPEMLAGQSPDEIGYFNEWSPSPLRVRPLPKWLRVLDCLRGFVYLNAGLRKILLAKILKKNYSNIPFKYAHHFAPQGSHDFRDLDNTILEHFDFDIFDAVDFRSLPVGKRDFAALSAACDQLESPNTLVSLTDYDNLAHIYGLGSRHVEAHLARLNQEIELLLKKYYRKYPSGKIVVFSDHGMVNVHSHVDLDLENLIGKMEAGSLLYFLDSTYLRIWVRDKAREKEILRKLEKLSVGHVIADEERSVYGISSKAFGQIMFRANEGFNFCPNFYGGRPVKAMHGYDSELESQKAFFAFDEKIVMPLHPSRSADVYAAVKSICNLSL